MIESKKNLILFLGIKAVVAVLIVLFLGINLAPDEAQYWTWSQFLDWGYYSKPPGIAWQIFLTTSLLGSSELGVRIGAVIINFCLPLAVYGAAHKITDSKRTAFYAAIATAFSPFGIFLAFPATTDLAMILFYVLALYAVVSGPRFLLAGLFILLGALFKWTAYSFWFFVLIAAFFIPKFRTKRALFGAGLSLMALLPSLYWNLTHDFATFRHVGTTLFQTGTSGHVGGNFFDFLGGQIGLIFPVYFVFLLIGLFCKKASWKLHFCTLFAYALGLFCILSLFKKMQPNWAFYLYPPIMIVAAYAAFEKCNSGKRWFVWGTYLSIIFSMIALLLPTIQDHNLLPIPYKINPFRQTLGWKRLPLALTKAGYHPDKDFLFSDKYQNTSLLSFYGPKQKRAYYFNLNRQRKNQFSYWPTMHEEQVGQTGYFVVLEKTKDFEKGTSWYEEHYTKELSPYFESIEVVSKEPLFTAQGKVVKFALVLRATNYNGKTPEASDSY